MPNDFIEVLSMSFKKFTCTLSWKHHCTYSVHEVSKIQPYYSLFKQGGGGGGTLMSITILILTLLCHTQDEVPL